MLTTRTSPTATTPSDEGDCGYRFSDNSLSYYNCSTYESTWPPVVFLGSISDTGSCSVGVSGPGRTRLLVHHLRQTTWRTERLRVLTRAVISSLMGVVGLLGSVGKAVQRRCNMICGRSWHRHESLRRIRQSTLEAIWIKTRQQRQTVVGRGWAYRRSSGREGKCMSLWGSEELCPIWHECTDLSHESLDRT